MKSSSVLALILLLPIAPAGAKITCKPSGCPSPGTVEAARAIVEQVCPCAAQTSAKRYRRCTRQALKTARQQLGTALTDVCVKDVKVAVAESACGRPGTVVCNKRNAKDTRTRCAVVGASRCKGSACGAFVSCADACNPSAQACAVPTRTMTSTTLGGGGPTSTTLGGGGTPTTSTTLGGGGTPTTSTILGGGTTTSSSSTTTTMPGYTCSITTAACVETACTCASIPGIDYHPGATGSVSGPVGTVLDVNSFPMQGGTMDCGGWTLVAGNPYGSTTVNCDLLSCCVRENAGQPESTTWTVYEMADLPCYCPSAPGPVSHNYVAQCQTPPGPVHEDYQTSGPCA